MNETKILKILPSTSKTELVEVSFVVFVVNDDNVDKLVHKVVVRIDSVNVLMNGNIGGIWELFIRGQEHR